MAEKKIGIPELINNTVNAIKAKERFATLKDTGEILQWHGDIWVSGGKANIERLAEIELDDANIHIVREVVEKIKRQTYVERDIFDSDANKLSVKNCVIDTSTGEILEHDPELYQTIQLPVIYDPAAECPVIDKFVNEVMADYAPLFYEMLAYCLIPDYRFRKFFIMLGESGTGKTTTIDLMCEFLGRQNIDSITLQNLADNRFAKTNLYGKLANLCDDLPKVEYNDVGQIKQLTGNSPISGEMKGIQKSVTFINRAKLIFSCNTLPKTKGSDEAFFSRLIIIPFNFKPKVKDNGLIDKLTTESELSGLLNKVLEARTRICKNNGFSIEQSIEQIQYMYNLGSLDSVSIYAHDRLEYDTIGRIVKEDLYNNYVEYCANKNIPAKEDNAFNRRLQELGYGETSRITIDNCRKWAYIGIKIKEAN